MLHTVWFPLIRLFNGILTVFYQYFTVFSTINEEIIVRNAAPCNILDQVLLIN